MKYVFFFCLFLALFGLNSITAQQASNTHKEEARLLYPTDSLPGKVADCLLSNPAGSSPGNPEANIVALALVGLGSGFYAYVEGWQQYCRYKKSVASFFDSNKLIKEYELEITIEKKTYFLTIPDQHEGTISGAHLKSAPAQKIVKTIIAFIEEKASLENSSNGNLKITFKVKIITKHDREFPLEPFYILWSQHDENEQYKAAAEISSIFALRRTTHLNDACYLPLISAGCFSGATALFALLFP